MSFRNHLALAAAIGGGLLLSSTTAFAHVSVTKVGTAGTNQLITFAVGHGCEGLDTVKIEVKIPEEVASLRAMPSAWGNPVFNRNDEQTITSVVWSKTESLPGDDMYYQFALRVAVPNAPFTTVLFPTTQTCLDAEGEEVVVEWAAAEAKLDDGEWEPDYLSDAPDPFDTFLSGLFGQSEAESAGPRDVMGFFAGRQAQVGERLLADLDRLLAMRGLQARCLECPAPAVTPPARQTGLSSRSLIARLLFD